MMMSTFIRTIPAFLVGSLCLLMAVPAMAAHPGSLWGIDLPSVIALRDQVRVMAHSHAEPTDGEQLLDGQELPQLQRVRTIVLDPGHGGNNSGATGHAGVAEKYLNLELAYDLRERLQKKYPDLRVILTRYWDASVEIPDRVHLANMANADLFISLHYNAAVHDRAYGYETYFLRPEEVTPGSEEVQGLPVASAENNATGILRPVEGVRPVGQYGDALMLIQQDLLRAHQHTLSGRLAEAVQDGFRDNLTSMDRGVKQANFAVLRGAHMPAVLVEVGFLTHPEEGFEILTPEHRASVSSSLITAIENFDSEVSETLSEVETGDSQDPQEDADSTADEAPVEPGV